MPRLLLTHAGTSSGVGGFQKRLSSASPPRALPETVVKLFPKLQCSPLKDLKDDEAEVARLRPAWGVARGQLIRTFENALQGVQRIENPDLDAPTSTSEEKERSQSFSEAYSGWVF